MKRLILAVLIVGAFGGLVFLGVRRNSPPSVPTQPTQESAPAQATETVVPENTAPSAQKTPRRNSTVAQERPATSEVTTSVARTNEVVSDELAGLRQAVDFLVSPQAGFDRKQTVWKQLQDEGRLDQTAALLEQQAKDNPNASEYLAALGEAYIYKIRTAQDIREAGILALKADQSFDAAVNVDPKNWEARYYKATALSYWAPEANKGQEVRQLFTDLIGLQETTASRPEFARSYVTLGEQYQKAGRPDDANQVWRRGATLFPTDLMLQKKLTAQ